MSEQSTQAALRKSIVLLALCLLCGGFAVVSRGWAGQVSVEAVEGLGVWSNPNSWSPQVVPYFGNGGNTYRVTIGMWDGPSRTYMITADMDASVDSLSVYNASLEGTRTISTAVVNLENAVLSGSGWIIAKDVSLERLVTLDRWKLDVVSQADSGWGVDLVGRNGAVITNGASATFRMYRRMQWDGTGQRPIFRNQGRLRYEGADDRAALPDKEAEWQWQLDNSGLVQVTGGTLKLSGGGNSTGEIDVQSGANLVFTGGVHTLGAGSFLHGDGIARFEGGTVNLGGEYKVVGTTYISGGTVNVDSAMGPIMMMMSGGTVGGNGNIATLGQIVWMGGTFAGKGKVISPLLLSISRADAKMIDGWSIISTGKAVWWGGAEVSAQNGGVFTNLGTFDAMGDGEFTFTGVGATPTFNNPGRFSKMAGTEAMRFSGVTFNNRGMVEVRSGRLELMGAVTQFVGGTLTGGEWDVYDGAALLFPTSGVGVIRNQGKVTLRGPGSVFGHMNALAMNEGTFSVLEGRSFTTAAGLTNTGMMVIGADSEVVVKGQFINTGIVQSMGSLSEEAGAGAMGAAGRPGLRVEGDLANLGMMNLSGGVEMAGDVSNKGTMSIRGRVNWREDAVAQVDGGRLVLGSDMGSADGARLRLELVGGGEALLDAEQHLKRLRIEEGRVGISAGGRKTLRTEGLEMGTEGWLDVGEHDLIVVASEGERERVHGELMGWIKAGRKGEAGVMSSAAGQYQALGLALNEKADGELLTQTFGGQSVDGNCVLVKYTWEGDANLDGVVNADDYFQIDSGFISQKGGWYNGDFNYDGVANADDYFLIDAAFLGQSGPMSDTRASAVPEGSVWGMVMAGVGLVAGRRRKRL